MTAAWESGGHQLLQDELRIWQERLDGKRKRMPDGFWGQNHEDTDAWARGLACARYLFEARLGLSRAALLDISFEDLLTYKLAGFRDFWHCSIHAIVAGAFPELNIQPWEMRRISNDFWAEGGRDAKVAALRWWLEQRQISAADVYRQLGTAEGVALKRQIEQATNAIESGDYVPLDELLRAIDPTLQARQPERDRSNDYPCPLCPRSARKIMQHLVRGHGLDRAAALELLAEHCAPAPGFLLTALVAEQLGVYSQTVAAAARDGRVAAERVGDLWWIDTTAPGYTAWCAEVQASPRHRAAQRTQGAGEEGATLARSSVTQAD
ncbi:MAG TPA: hypothetical protein VFS21_19315 [Roseiflexaceae bacterium]|nr:hypothetical protein [Roseiflexaceae bacterium]